MKIRSGLVRFAADWSSQWHPLLTFPRILALLKLWFIVFLDRVWFYGQVLMDLEKQIESVCQVTLHPQRTSPHPFLSVSACLNTIKIQLLRHELYLLRKKKYASNSCSSSTWPSSTTKGLCFLLCRLHGPPRTLCPQPPPEPGSLHGLPGSRCRGRHPRRRPLPVSRRRPPPLSRPSILLWTAAPAPFSPVSSQIVRRISLLWRRVQEPACPKPCSHIQILRRQAFDLSLIHIWRCRRRG